MNNKCAVCGNEVPTMPVPCSCDQEVLDYCLNCLTAGVEPYEKLVGMKLLSSNLNKTYKNRILYPSLQYWQKTVEQFDEDVWKLFELNDDPSDASENEEPENGDKN